MSIFDEAKIDCHNHILDPKRFPYQPDTPYRPSGQEIATPEQFHAVLDTYGVRHALVVGPNSGYGTDNRCLLDVIEKSNGRFKGVAVVANDTSTADLAALKAQGIVGIAFNATRLGVGHWQNTTGLLKRMADLDLFLQLQVEKDQILAFKDLIETTRVHLVIDHCGIPDVAAGLDQRGFQTVLALGRGGRASVKLSGYAKFSQAPIPHQDAWPYVRALIDAFTLDNCVWGSDWPFLRAEQRADYGPLLKLVERLFPNPADRHKVLWETPCRLFGFGSSTKATQ